MQKIYNTIKCSKLLLVLLFLLMNTFLFAQNNINRVEYFFDTDPGFGNATSIPISASSDIQNQMHSIDISAVSNGFHNFFIRSRDDSGNWSVTASSTVFRSSFGANANAPIVKAEYFFDADPGFGNATAISLSSNNNIQDVVLSIDLTNVTNGFHQFNIRSQDANGVWSVTNMQPVFKTGSNSSVSNITACEYFFDTDPGFGNGNPISFTAAANVADQILSINISSLSNGFHSLFIRSKDANGNWSITNSSPIFKTSSGTALANIVKAEFFIDTDPGFGNAINIPVTAGLNISDYVASVVNPHTLTAGQHFFFIRTKDANGVWSITNNVEYTVYPNSQFDNITLTGCGFVQYDDSTFTANTTVVDTFKSVNYGYDSLIRTATIVVNPTYSFTQTLNLSGCNSVSYKNVAYTSSISFIDTVKTSKGCDSIYKTINITVYNVSTTTNTETLIGFGSYTFNSVTYTSNATVRDTVKTANNCDSVYNIHNIVVINPTVQNSTLLGCGNVTYNGVTYNSSTTVYDTLHSQTGCDSIYKHITVTVISPITLNHYLSGCNMVNYKSVNYYTSTIVNDTVKSSLGCDSLYNIVHISVTAVSPVNQTVNISGCNSVVYNNVTYTSSTTLNIIVASYQGCDSVYKTVNITVYHRTPTTNSSTYSGCNNVVFNNQNYTSSVVLRDTLRDSNGCDSIYNVVNINVTTVNAVTQNINVAGCDSATYNSVKYFASATLHDTLKSYQGCDSIYKVINITVQQKPTIVVSASINPVCATNATVLTASGGGNYTWSPSTGLSGTSGASVSASPANTITYTVTSNQTCVVSKTITITIKPMPNVDAGANQSILLGSSTTLTATGAASYVWNTGNAADTTASINVAPTSNTNYIVTGTAANGCTAQDLVSVAVNFSSLSVNTNNYNFGNVVVNSAASTNIVVTNNGTLAVTINGASTSNHYSSGIASQSLAAGASISIPVSFTPTATLFYTGNLTISTSIGNFVVSLQGRGVAPAPAWVVTPNNRSFGNIRIGDSAMQTFTLVNTGNIPVNVSSITSSSAVFKGTSGAGSIAVGGSTTITVKYKPTAITTNTATITIHSSTSGLANTTANVDGSGYINNTPPTLHFVSSSPYNGTKGVNPSVGWAGLYTYNIVYKSSTNTAPQAGYPKVGIDVNGDGDFIDVDEGIFSMNQINASTNWVAGEEYTFTANLAVGNTYSYQFFANDSLGNPASAVNASRNSGPIVTDQTLDLSIYANDISFSVPHPAVGQTFTVFATVHNNTPYSASNVNVRFYTDSVYYNQLTIPFIAGNSTETVSMNFTYNLDGFYPIKVWIDSAGALGETLALNNFAIRPIIVGNFTVPGAIIVNANAREQHCPDAMVVSGNAYYTGLNLSGNPPVLGAYVEVKENGNVIGTTYTTTEGFYQVYIPHSCGNGTYSVEVTDYTLTGVISSKPYSIACNVSCDPGTPGINYDPKYTFDASGLPCCIIAGQSFNNTFTFTNRNTYKYTNDTVLVYADDTLKYTYTRDSIAAGQTVSYTSSFSFNAGSHKIKYVSYHHYSYQLATLDTTGGGNTLVLTTYTGIIKDSSVTNLYIDISKPDLTLSSFVQTAAKSFVIKVGNGTCINAGASKLYVYEANSNYDIASTVLIDSVNTAPVLAGKCGDTRVNVNYTRNSWANGYHYLILKADGGNVIDELNENNNTVQVAIYVPQPEVYVESILASNSNVQSGDNINFITTIKNSGSTASNFKVQFYVNNVPLGPKQNISTLNNNASTTLSSVIYTIPNNNCPLEIKVVADVDNDLTELNKDNNRDSIAFGSDITSGNSCYNIGSACNSYVVYIGSSLTMSAPVSNIGLRDVDITGVRFNLVGNAIGTDNIAHIAAQTTANVSLTHTFNTVGNYVVEIEPDYNNDYCENDESNNLGYIYVTVTNALPDLQVLSHFISPSNLNPNPGQAISIATTVKNIGNAASQPSLVRFWVDNVQLGNDIPLNSIKVGRDTAVAASATYTGNSVGPKIIKVTIYYGEGINGAEQNFGNNEATRSVIVGAAPDFARTINEGIKANRNKYRIGKQITLSNYIRNYGGDNGSAYLKFYYRDTFGIRTLIDSVPFSINHHDSARISKRWTVAGYGRIITEIVNSNPQEFNVLNNIDSMDLVIDTTTPSVIITPNLSNVCEGTNITFTASSTNIIAPRYVWKFNGVLTGDTAATYTHTINVGDYVSCRVLDEEQYLITSSNTAPTLRLKTYSTTNGTRCSNQLPFVWNGGSYTTTGTYIKVFTNTAGCDSIATLVFKVLQASSSTTKDSIFSGSSYTFNGNTYTSSGTYIVHLTNSLGCDSAATLILTVKPLANGAAINGIFKSCTYATNRLTCSASNGVWSSSDTTVAKINQQGIIAPVANGTTTIKYTYIVSGITYQSTVIYTVAIVPMPNPIVGVTNICAGGTTTYTNATPNGVWAINGRASISQNGFVNALTAGVTTIFYTVSNAAGCSNVVNLDLTINANPAMPDVSYGSGNTVNPQAGAPGGSMCKNRTFNLAGYPSGGTWGATGVFAVNNAGVVNTGNITGSGTFSYTVTNNNGCRNARTFSFNVANCATKGVTQQPLVNNLQFTVYPNPAHDIINIKTENLTGAATIVVTDLYGKQIKQQPVSIGNNIINITGLAKGMYFVSLITERGKETSKIVVE